MPTLLQTVLRQPSQKYAPHCSTQRAQQSSHSLNIRLNTSPFLSSNINLASESEKASPTDMPPSPPLSQHSSDSTDIFFTPSSSPTSMSPRPMSPSPSSAPSSAFEDDIFSCPSAVTSATSLSVSSSKHERNTPFWAKDVRWLAPQQTRTSSSSSLHSRSTLPQGLSLVDVVYDPPRSRSSSKRRRKSHASSSVRMSALWEVEEDDDGHNLPKHVPSRARTVSDVRPSRPTILLSRASSTTASTSHTVTLPTPLSVSSGADTRLGYSGLTLPRAGYAPAKHPDRVSSTVDITRSGLAQTTMSTISIARRAQLAPKTPAHLQTTLPSPLSFQAHTSPPSKVQSRQILVQVWAVGLDGLDARFVDEQAGKSDGYGYIPGRSFVGKAVECGWDVNNVSKGDWVFGITQVRKSGSLAEFIVVDCRRAHRSPHPSPRLTIDQIALLPLAGIPAHRAVRTLLHLPRGARALVLHAHDGAGLLATQELAVLGFRITAQVPGAWGTPAERRARKAGAGDVRCGKAVEIVADVNGEEFDAVIDTLGGKDVWDACCRVLRTSGQFTTLVGDTDSGLPTANAHFKSNMRSLRRAFVKKDRKSIGYQWVSPAADVDSSGEDIRDSLAAVAHMAADGILVPHATVLPFERAQEAFEVDPTTGISMLTRGGTAVIRIIE